MEFIQYRNEGGSPSLTIALKKILLLVIEYDSKEKKEKKELVK
jgi:hypothetical protein